MKKENGVTRTDAGVSAGNVKEMETKQRIRSVGMADRRGRIVE